SIDHKDQHICCFTHILNICSGHVVEKITDTTLTEIAGKWVSALPQDLNDRQTYQQALTHDPLTLGCAVVASLCASGQHHDVFEEYIKEGNEKGYYSRHRW
ncbi:hypothetical protein PAXRUDRAFT_164837, partial [Paxillus rubicundulus Ve08.2h10]